MAQEQMAAISRLVERAVFDRRREFLTLVGAGTATAALASVFPLGAAQALAEEKLGPNEKKDLEVGFIPITCATPIIMAELHDQERRAGGRPGHLRLVALGDAGQHRLRRRRHQERLSERVAHYKEY